MFILVYVYGTVGYVLFFLNLSESEWICCVDLYEYARLGGNLCLSLWNLWQYEQICVNLSESVKICAFVQINVDLYEVA